MLKQIYGFTYGLIKYEEQKINYIEWIIFLKITQGKKHLAFS